MKKCEYLEVNEVLDLEQTLDKSTLNAEKKDEVALPKFVKELPVKKRIKESADLVTVDYEWNEPISDDIKVKSIEYKKDERLDDLYRIIKKDGSDDVLIKHANKTYVLRRTTKNIALALMNIYNRLEGLVENVVGWLRTLLGNIYMIVKVGRWNWTFNKNLANGNGYELNSLSIDSLDEKNKEKLSELLVPKLVELQKKGLVMRNFSVNNLWLANDNVIFADLRNLKLAKKKSVLVEEFRKTLNYLFSVGIVTRADVYAAIAYYISTMEDSCSEWYSERIGKNANDSFDVALEIEKATYN